MPYTYTLHLTQAPNVNGFRLEVRAANAAEACAMALETHPDADVVMLHRDEWAPPIVKEAVDRMTLAMAAEDASRRELRSRGSESR